MQEAQSRLRNSKPKAGSAQLNSAVPSFLAKFCSVLRDWIQLFSQL